MIRLFKSFAPQKETIDLINDVISSGYMSEGPLVKKFEKELAKFYGIDEIMCTNSCTSAITIALRCADIKENDEVITTPLTCIATNIPILQLGGKIRWADVNKNNGMISPESVKKLVNKKTKAIIVLHKEGDYCELKEIREIAKNYNIPVIEDCAHVWRTENRGEKLPFNSDFACFSYQAIKHINTGDGGALYCKPKYRDLAKKYKWFGIDRDKRNPNVWLEDISVDGYKMNMNDITGAFGLAQLQVIEPYLQKTYSNGRLYDLIFGHKKNEIMTSNDRDINRSSYWAYPIKVNNREELINKLTYYKIEARQIHPRNDTLKIFKDFKEDDLPNLNKFDTQELCLPCGWWVNEAEIEMISEIVLKYSR